MGRFGLFVVASGAALIAAASLSAGADTAQRDAAQDVLAQLLETDGGPGVMAAVIQDGNLVWAGAAGMADLEGGRLLTNETPMRIGSVSKTLTATLALRLWEDGAFDIDADIGDHIPQLVVPGDAAVTARQLAGHTSGIRHYDFANYLEANNVFFYESLAAGNAAFMDGAFIASPGEAHHYTSIGYNMLGVAIESATEVSFGAALDQQVAEPLGLDHTMIDHPLEIIPNRTRFHTKFPDGVVRNTIWRDSSDFYPSGGILSTATDLARFAAAVFGGDWLGEHAMDAVTTETRTLSGDGVGYTFGWQIHYGDNGRVEWYEHGGETNGGYAVIRYFPEQDLAVAGIMNANHFMGEPAFFSAITGDLADIFMGE